MFFITIFSLNCVLLVVSTGNHTDSPVNESSKVPPSNVSNSDIHKLTLFNIENAGPMSDVMEQLQTVVMEYIKFSLQEHYKVGAIGFRTFREKPSFQERVLVLVQKFEEKAKTLLRTAKRKVVNKIAKVFGKYRNHCSGAIYTIILDPIQESLYCASDIIVASLYRLIRSFATLFCYETFKDFEVLREAQRQMDTVITCNQTTQKNG